MAEQIVYQVKGWDALFEGYKSRTYDNKSSCQMPNKHGLGYKILVRRKNGPALFGAWCALVQVLSKHPKPRYGYLTDTGRIDGRPYTPEDLSLLTDMPADLFSELLDVACTPGIEWMNQITNNSASSSDLRGEDTAVPAQYPQEDSVVSTDSDSDSDSDSNNKTLPESDDTGTDTEPKLPKNDIIDLWNRTAGAVRGMSTCHAIRDKTKRYTLLKARWREHPDWSWWRQLFEMIAASPFLTGSNERGWRADIDWAVKPGNAEKVLEGKYEGRKSAAAGSGKEYDV